MMRRTRRTSGACGVRVNGDAAGAVVDSAGLDRLAVRHSRVLGDDSISDSRAAADMRAGQHDTALDMCALPNSDTVTQDSRPYQSGVRADEYVFSIRDCSVDVG